MSLITITFPMPTGIVGLPEAIAKALPEVAVELKNDIRSEAQRALASTRETYKQSVLLSQFALSPKKMRRTPTKFAVISLNGFLANAIESGWSGGNMVGWLVKGRSGNGQFATIRFRHIQPGKGGDMSRSAHGQRMGGLEGERGMSKQKAGLLGKAIARAAKKTLTDNAKPPKMGSTQMEAQMSSNTAAKAGALIMKGKAKGARRHASSIYKGMSKRVDTGGTNQTTYETYRRASVNVGGKWIHPGITAHDFFGKALQKFPKRVDRMIYHVVEGMRNVK
mgnify:CR=1 FL=1